MDWMLWWEIEAFVRRIKEKLKFLISAPRLVREYKEEIDIYKGFVRALLESGLSYPDTSWRVEIGPYMATGTVDVWPIGEVTVTVNSELWTTVYFDKVIRSPLGLAIFNTTVVQDLIKNTIEKNLGIRVELNYDDEHNRAYIEFSGYAVLKNHRLYNVIEYLAGVTVTTINKLKEKILESVLDDPENFINSIVLTELLDE